MPHYIGVQVILLRRLLTISRAKVNRKHQRELISKIVAKNIKSLPKEVKLMTISDQRNLLIQRGFINEADLRNS